jgi:hypothetical protein
MTSETNLSDDLADAMVEVDDPGDAADFFAMRTIPMMGPDLSDWPAEIQPHLLAMEAFPMLAAVSVRSRVFGIEIDRTVEIAAAKSRASDLEAIARNAIAELIGAKPTPDPVVDPVRDSLLKFRGHALNQEYPVAFLAADDLCADNSVDRQMIDGVYLRRLVGGAAKLDSPISLDRLLERFRVDCVRVGDNPTYEIRHAYGTSRGSPRVSNRLEELCPDELLPIELSKILRIPPIGLLHAAATISQTALDSMWKKDDAIRLKGSRARGFYRIFSFDWLVSVPTGELTRIRREIGNSAPAMQMVRVAFESACMADDVDRARILFPGSSVNDQLVIQHVLRSLGFLGCTRVAGWMATGGVATYSGTRADVHHAIHRALVNRHVDTCAELLRMTKLPGVVSGRSPSGPPNMEHSEVWRRAYAELSRRASDEGDADGSFARTLEWIAATFANSTRAQLDELLDA